MKLAYALVALPFLGFACGTVAAKPHVDPGRYVRTLQEGEIARSYILRVPRDYDNRHELPLVIMLHGWTSNKEQAEAYTGFGSLSDREGFVLAVPDGTEGLGTSRGWNCGFLNLGKPEVDDVAFLKDLIDSLEKDLYVDRKRVYVAGHSNGAMMAALAGAKLSDKIGAVGVVSGSIGIDKPAIPEPSQPISAILIHGKQDNVVPYDATAQALIKSLPAPDCAKWWATQDACAPLTETREKEGQILVDDFRTGKRGAEVELITLTKGTHDWPSDFPAAERIWSFFKSHPKR